MEFMPSDNMWRKYFGFEAEDECANTVEKNGICAQYAEDAPTVETASAMNTKQTKMNTTD